MPYLRKSVTLHLRNTACFFSKYLCYCLVQNVCIYLNLTNRLLIKLYKYSTNISVINDCRLYFGTKPPSELLLKRREKVLVAYSRSDNNICKMYA